MNNMLTPHAMRCLAALVMLAASCGLLVRRREPRTRVYLINPPAVDHGKLAAAQCGQAPRAAATGTAAGPDCARMLACACDLAAARGMRRAPVAPAPCPKGAKLLILMRHVRRWLGLGHMRLDAGSAAAGSQCRQQRTHGPITGAGYATLIATGGVALEEAS